MTMTWTEGASLSDQFAEAMNMDRAASMFVNNMQGLHDHVLSEALTKLGDYLKNRRKGARFTRQTQVRELVLAEMGRRVAAEVEARIEAAVGHRPHGRHRGCIDCDDMYEAAGI